MMGVILFLVLTVLRSRPAERVWQRELEQNFERIRGEFLIATPNIMWPPEAPNSFLAAGGWYRLRFRSICFTTDAA